MPSEIKGSSNFDSDSAGKVLQVVSTTKTDTFTTSSTSFVDITGLSVSITPSSTSNKIKITYNVFASSVNPGEINSVRMLRDSTPINVSTVSSNNTTGFHQSNENYNSTVVAGTYLDSPATTSATTYKFQCYITSGTATINRRGEADTWGAVSSITVEEISA